MPEKFYRYEVGSISWIHADPPTQAPVPTFAVMNEIEKPAAMQYARDKLRYELAHASEIKQEVVITSTEALLLLELIEELTHG